MKTGKLFLRSNSGRSGLLKSAIFSFLVVLGLSFGAVETVPAQSQPKGAIVRIPPLRRPVNPTLPPRPVCRPTQVYIRNLLYNDYSRYTSLPVTTVNPGGFFRIVTNCLPLNGQVVVTLQDVSRGSGFGVTAFRLTNVRVNGNVVTAQAPNLPLFRNRTYQVAVFVYGQQPWKTANPGQLTIR